MSASFAHTPRHGPDRHGAIGAPRGSWRKRYHDVNGARNAETSYTLTFSPLSILWTSICTYTEGAIRSECARGAAQPFPLSSAQTIMAAKVLYREMSGKQWQELSGDYLHAAHAMLFAEWPGKFMDKYDYRYAVMMQVRFDGTLGFPGGLVDAGESPEEAACREVKEETGHNGPELQLTAEDHVCTHSSHHTKLCLHFFCKQLTLEQLQAVESSVPRSSSWGEEVLGVLRVPLYTLPNGLGLPAFLKNQFIGSSQQQLLLALERRGLLGRTELEEAVRVANTINTMVTKEDIQY